MRSNFYPEFGRRVRRLREAAELTQAALGARVGLDRTTITSIESGRHGVPLHVLVELADALGCAPGDIIPSKHDLVPVLESDNEAAFVTRIRTQAQRQSGRVQSSTDR